MRYVPWHVKGVRPAVREAARNAARRSGLSVGAWLNLLMVDAAAARRWRPASFDPGFQPARIDEATKALMTLEQRIGALIDKLAIFAAQSDRRDGADRRMDELLAQLRELRAQHDNGLAAIKQQVATSAADAISSPAESIRRDVASLKEIQTSVDRRTHDTFEAVYGTIEQVVDRLTVIENQLRDRHSAPPVGRLADEPEGRPESAYPPPFTGGDREAATPGEAPALAPVAADHAVSTPALRSPGEHDWGATAPAGTLPARPATTAVRLRHPAVLDFAPDLAVEPVSGPRRVRAAADTIDRIAASEAAPSVAKRAETSAPARSRFVAAARRATEAVAGEHDRTPANRFGRPGGDTARHVPRGTLFKRLRPRTKSVILGGGAVLLIIGALRLAFDFLHASAVRESVPPVAQIDDAAQPGGQSARSEPPLPPRHDANVESAKRLFPGNANEFPNEAVPGRAGGQTVSPDMVAPLAIPISQTTTTTPVSDPARQARQGTAGAAPVRNTPLQGAADRDSAAPDLTARPLPPTIGSKALLAAAAAGDPSACYEIAIRFAQGHNATQDLAMAAAWLERAARSGLAPAQFRLGGMYEKGLGVTKDLAEARRLYVAAADKGHAKAMHNLAVLYSAGLDGKPDYAVASQWFRRAAAYGLVDSQYNLAILYARGAGIERNFAESYKWFALAAKGGDKDAARKRDEIAMRLDAKQLESAKLNAESFVVVPQPEEATAVYAPAGGWDQAVAAATTKSKTFVKSERFLGR